MSYPTIYLVDLAFLIRKIRHENLGFAISFRSLGLDCDICSFGNHICFTIGIATLRLDWAIAFNAFQMYEYIVIESK